MLRNITSSSGGGKLDRDHAAATLYRSDEFDPEISVVNSGTYSDYASQVLHIDLFALDKIGQRTRFLRLFYWGGWGGKRH
jgi:hypothetical protein